MSTLILKGRPPLRNSIGNGVRESGTTVNSIASTSSWASFDPTNQKAVVVEEKKLGLSSCFDEVAAENADVAVKTVGAEMHVAKSILLKAHFEVGGS